MLEFLLKISTFHVAVSILTDVITRILRAISRKTDGNSCYPHVIHAANIPLRAHPHEFELLPRLNVVVVLSDFFGSHCKNILYAAMKPRSF